MTGLGVVILGAWMAASPVPILVVNPPHGQASHRLCAEAKAVGMQCTIIRTSKNVHPDELCALAAQHHTPAAMLYQPQQFHAVIWVHPNGGQPTKLVVTVPPGTPAAELAVRTVEQLRALLLPSPSLPSEPPVPEPPVPLPPEPVPPPKQPEPEDHVPPVTSEFAEIPRVMPPAPRRAWIWPIVSVGQGVAVSPGAWFMPHPEVRVRWEPTPLGVEAWFWPTVGPFRQEHPRGLVDLAVSVTGAGVRLASHSTGRSVSSSLTVGALAAGIMARGWNAWNQQNEFMMAGGLGGYSRGEWCWSPVPHLVLSASALLGGWMPRTSVQIAGREIASPGLPLASMSMALGLQP